MTSGVLSLLPTARPCLRSLLSASDNKHAPTFLKKNPDHLGMAGHLQRRVEPTPVLWPSGATVKCHWIKAVTVTLAG